jgi:hypothetical protein
VLTATNGMSISNVPTLIGAPDGLLQLGQLLGP